jgi:hypothetical protein
MGVRVTGVGLLLGSGAGPAWSADDIVRIGDVPAGTIRLGNSHPNAIRFSGKPSGPTVLSPRRIGPAPSGTPAPGTRTVFGERPYSVAYFSNDERANRVDRPPSSPLPEEPEWEFELANGTILKRAHFQRLPDGWFRIAHQAGLGNYHIREFVEKDRLILSAWQAQEISNWTVDPSSRQSIGLMALNKRKLDFMLIPEIELADVRLDEVVRFVESYSLENDPGRKRMKIVLDVWDPTQRVTLPVQRYVSLNQLLRRVAQKTGTVLTIGAETVNLRDPTKVSGTLPR